MLLERIVRSGKPHLPKSPVKAMQEISDRWYSYPGYSYNSVGIFLNDHDKWSTLPSTVRMISQLTVLGQLPLSLHISYLYLRHLSLRALDRVAQILFV
jgi:hypothetical protein